MKYLVIIVSAFLISIISITFIYKKYSYKIESISKFEFHYTTGNAYNDDVLYKIICNDVCSIIIKPEGYSQEDINEIEISDDDINKLIDILNKYNVSRWNNFSKLDKRVLDGKSFSIFITQKNGKYISASGYMKYPRKYKNLKEEIDNLFNSIKK